MPVGLVIVSHSRPLADGTVALAGQMAPSVEIRAAGGTDDGEIGTSFDLIAAALAQADAGDGVVVLYDLGSALLTAETAVEFLEPDQAERVRIVDAPLVEGAIAAAVAAEGGADLDAVAAAASAAAGEWAASPSASAAPSAQAGSGPTRDVTIINPLGLHARPAAELARAVAEFDASVRVARGDEAPVDLTSVLGVVGRAFRGGDTVTLSACGTDAQAALDRVARLVEGGFGEAGQAPVAAPSTSTSTAGDARLDDGLLTATPGSDGMAVGALIVLGDLPASLPARDGADAEAEGTRLDEAIAAAARGLESEGEFGRAHAALVRDPELRRAADAELARGAEHAWWNAVTESAGALEGSADELIAARGVDMREAGAAVLARLGVRINRIPADAAGAVVLADDLGPAEVPALAEAGAAAAVLRQGSVTAHAVIVARGLGFPLVLRAGEALDAVAAGTTVVLDGGAGTVRVDPPPPEADAARHEVALRASRADERRAAAQQPVTMPDGTRVLVAANVGSLADARAAVANGADAVGLLRTELLVLDLPVYPDEDTQAGDLAAIFDVLGDRPVTVRVLDAGGDKPVATLDVGPEHNGFMGVRGLRYLLQHPELLHTQLRAIMRVAHGHRVSVMAPMVTVRGEAEAFRTAVDAAAASLQADGATFAPPEAVGIMVEVPAAALDAEQFAGVADFFSVGSNDLTSYLMAAERTEPGVADLLDPAAAAVGAVLDLLCQAAGRASIPVAVCGEMAADPALALQLVARGVTELSVAPARIPHIKEALRQSRS